MTRIPLLSLYPVRLRLQLLLPRLQGLSGRMRFLSMTYARKSGRFLNAFFFLWDSFTTASDFESIETVLCDVLLSHGIGYLGVVHSGSEGRPVLC